MQRVRARFFRSLLAPGYDSILSTNPAPFRVYTNWLCLALFYRIRKPGKTAVTLFSKSTCCSPSSPQIGFVLHDSSPRRRRRAFVRKQSDHFPVVVAAEECV